MTALFASLPLQLVCQLIVTRNLNVTENGIPVSFGYERPLQTSSVAIPENYVLLPSLGVAYRIQNESVSWNEARKLCILDGGNLAVIDSWEKQKIMKGMNSLNSSLYVGIHNMFNDGEWVRANNGLPVTSIPWAPSNPSRTGNCLVLFRDGSGIGDTKCSYPFPFVCEIEMDKN